jgi:hypothetical protein
MLNVRYDARKLAAIQKMLNELPHGAMSVAVPAINDYLMGEGKSGGGTAYHGLKHYPAFRAHPGGQQFPMRTGNLQRGWQTTKSAPYRQTIFNRVPYAKWIHGDDTQTWRAAYGNWRTISKIVTDNIKGAMLSAKQAVARWIKSKKVL